MKHFIEIRSLNIKPGKYEEFHRLYIKEALPLLNRWDFDVVAHGPSLHDENSYYSSAALTVSPNVSRWRNPITQRLEARSARGDAGFDRESLRADIVLELDDVTVNGLRGV